MPDAPTALDLLADEWVETLLGLYPEMHVQLGRPGREGEYADLSPDGHAAAAEATRATLARVRAAEAVGPDDAITRSELIRTLELAVEQHEDGAWRRDLNVIASPAQGIRDVLDLMPDVTDDDRDALELRLRNVPAALAGYQESLRAGIAAADTPALRQVEAVIEQVGRLTGDDGYFARVGTPAADVARDAYGGLARFLSDELAPRARTTDAVGRERYALASRAFVGTTIDLDETYAWGLENLRLVVEEQEQVAAQIVPGGGVREAIAALEADPSRALHGTNALQAWMQETSDAAVDALAGVHFDVPDPLRRLECRIAPTQEGGIYYTPPSEDFSRPGRMWWSVPVGVERFDTWRELTTVYHEGVPGHHLQLGTAILAADRLNAWRRLNWNSGHGEGWALYAERLMADLGHLDDPADRLGMLDAQRMRAARVVLDLGVHLAKPRPDGQGTWDADFALAFMTEHVAMNAPFIRFEVLRYLGWAGQAPSYAVGQRLWQQLRDDWTRHHGDDLRRFHREALAVGSVGMGTLREHLLAA